MSNRIFHQAEFDARLARVRAGMGLARVAAAIFDEIDAMAWLSGYGSSPNR